MSSEHPTWHHTPGSAVRQLNAPIQRPHCQVQSLTSGPALKLRECQVKNRKAVRYLINRVSLRHCMESGKSCSQFFDNFTVLSSMTLSATKPTVEQLPDTTPGLRPLISPIFLHMALHSGACKAKTAGLEFPKIDKEHTAPGPPAYSRIDICVHHCLVSESCAYCMSFRSPFTNDRRQLAQAAGIAVLHTVDNHRSHIARDATVSGSGTAPASESTNSAPFHA